MIDAAMYVIQIVLCAGFVGVLWLAFNALTLGAPRSMRARRVQSQSNQTTTSRRSAAAPPPRRPVKPPVPRCLRYFAAECELGDARRVVFVHIRDVSATDEHFLLCRDGWMLGDDVSAPPPNDSGRATVRVPGGVARVCPACRALSVNLPDSVQDDPPSIDAARPEDVERRTFLPGGIILLPGETYSEPERR